MAIELGKEKTVRASFWTVLVFVIIGLAVVFLAASYIYFFVSDKNNIKKIEEINASMAQLNSTIAQKENELELMQAKIDDYDKLISNHKNLVSVFEFLEGKAIANVWFDGFDFSSVDQNSILLSGVGPNFVVVGQQVNLFKKEEIVKDVYLDDISIGQDGEITFMIKLIFRPEIFYPEEI